MSAYTDLVRLAENNGGKIPASIPAHYVQWAWHAHRAAKGLPHALTFDLYSVGILDKSFPNTIAVGV